VQEKTFFERRKARPSNLTGARGFKDLVWVKRAGGLQERPTGRKKEFVRGVTAGRRKHPLGEMERTFHTTRYAWAGEGRKSASIGRRKDSTGHCI